MFTSLLCLLHTCIRKYLLTMPELDLFNINTDKLFEQYTISEIIEIHKKIQVELDRKKHELRTMVGERYRDVITAADAIKFMQNSAEKLYLHIGDINTKSHILQNSINIQESEPVIIDKHQNHNRSVAIQIRILVSIPEYIWTCLDNWDFLKAANLYLFAMHIHTGLELDTEYKTAEKFTILSRLKLSINAFRNRILDGITKKLKDVRLDPKEASKHLCAFILLQNKSQEFVLSELIKLRTTSIENLLSTDISVHNIVRIQIMNLINCLMCTIMLIHTCFIGNIKDYNMQSDGLVQIQMKQILSPQAKKTIELIDIDPTLLLQYLPAIVKNFRPSSTEGQKTLSKYLIKTTVTGWLQSTLNHLKENLAKSFEFITSVKSLQNIREEAYKIESSIENWSGICTDTYLPSHFTVWNHFFQPLVSKRVETLICIRIESGTKHLCGEIDNALGSVCDQSEKDLRWFVWREEADDLNKDVHHHGGLTMKTKGHSNKIVALCKEIDDKYSELLQDVNIYLDGTEDEEIRILGSHLRREVAIGLEKLIVYIEQIIFAQVNISIKITQSVMAARFLQAISALCPNVISCCSYGDNPQDWKVVHSNLASKSIEFWNDWLTSTQDSIKELLLNFVADTQAHNMLKILPKWNTIEIDEQTDDKVFKSQIQIPAGPSLSLLEILYEISNNLNGILPHTLPKQIHSKFTEINADLILQKYESLAPTLNQNLALQFLLDVKFLTTVCVKRDSKELMKKSQLICDQLRSKIDPFDLDVFYPYLQQHVKRSVLQSQSLFGCFLPAPAQLASLGTLDSKHVDIEPCIIAVSVPSAEIWFPLLPVTAPVTKTINAGPSQILRREVLTLKDDTGATLRSGAAALFGAMTNDWFS